MEMLKPPPPERKERGPMKQSDFYLAMVAGMVAIVIALSVNAYATWTAVECTSVYYTEDTVTRGFVHHTCFDRDGHAVASDTQFVSLNPRTPPLGE